MRDAGSAPSPRPIMELATAYWASQALFTANRLDLFAELETPQQAEALAAARGWDLRVTQMLLDALVGLGLLETGPEGYAGTDMARMYLVPGAPSYMGNAIRYSDNLYDSWSRLARTLETGAPAMQTEAYTGDDPKLTRDFVYAMHDRAMGIAAAMVDLVSLQGARRMLDVGGGPGTYSAMFVKRTPGLRSTVLDLPGVVAHVPDITATLGIADEVTPMPGDFHRTVFPGGQDVVLISGVLHREGPDFCRELIERARSALNPGGRLVLADVFLRRDDPASRAFAPLFGLNMALTAEAGQVHDLDDVTRWMQDAGFERLEQTAFPPPLPHALVTACKA